MIIKILRGQNGDGCDWERMDCVGEFTINTYPLYDCPEDATLSRDLISCSEIADYMKIAYEHGKNGEDFTVTVEEDNE